MHLAHGAVEPAAIGVSLLSMLADDLRALVFDVFGTCVDWRGSVIRAGEELGRKRGLNVDWPRLADEWRREGYIGPIAKIRSGEMPYVSSDVLFRRKLDELLPRYGVTSLAEEDVHHLALAWRRLDPWPDTVAGLAQLEEALSSSRRSRTAPSPP